MDLTRPNTKTNFRIDIQILRGIAVIAVVLFHLNPSYFKNGYLGVDLFFILSGFVVFPLILEVITAPSLSQRIDQLKYFYFRRFYRLAPALSATLVFSWILVFLMGLTTEHARFLKLAISSLLIAGNYGAYRYSWGNYFESFPNPLIHLWSLSAEEQIYIIIPFLFLFFSIFSSFSKRSRSLFILSVTVIIGIISEKLFFPGLLKTLGIRDPNGLIFYSPFSHIWEFALGGILSISFLRFEKITNYFARQITGFAVLVALILALYLPLDRNLETILIAVLSSIVIATRSALIMPRYLKSFLHWTGDRSYAIYLVHMPLIYICYYSPYLSNISRTYLYLPIVVTIGGVSHFIYNQIEAKYRLLGKSLKLNLRNTLEPLAKFVIVPLVIFILLLFTIANNNFSFVSGSMPKYAGSSDDNCNRLNSGKPCYYPVSNQKGTSLLIGDSIATAYADEFVQQSARLGFTAITMTLAGCNFIRSSNLETRRYLGLFANHDGKIGDNEQTCFDHNRDIISFITKYKPHVVYLSQHTIDKVNFEPQISIQDYRDLVLQEIASLARITPNLVVIGPPPLLPADLKIAEGTLFKIFGSKMNIESKRVHPEYFKEDEFLKMHLADIGVTYRSLREVFCSNLECTTFKNGKWLYFDSSHLSVEGASYLKGLFT